MTVIAKYEGTPVKALQQLRRDAREGGTKVKVVKNRLVIQAIKATDSVKDVDTGALQGMLLYAFNSEDEVAPAQSLQSFAKKNPSLEFVGAITPKAGSCGAKKSKPWRTCPARNNARHAGRPDRDAAERPVQGVMGWQVGSSERPATGPGSQSGSS